MSTGRKRQVVDVTDRVQEVVSTGDSLCVVQVPHTTAGVVVNENETGLLSDIEDLLAELVPEDDWEHDRMDDNAEAHLRSVLVGSSVSIPVENGRLDLGRWQSVLFIESDGPRDRKLKIETV